MTALSPCRTEGCEALCAGPQCRVCWKKGKVCEDCGAPIYSEGKCWTCLDNKPTRDGFNIPMPGEPHTSVFIPFFEKWREEGNCYTAEWRLNLGGTADPDVFFPEVGERNKGAAAKAICENCPVKQECLDFALLHNEPFGIWGGMNTKERTQEKRRRRQERRSA